MISRIATLGTSLYVGAKLFYCIINGHWGAVAFMTTVVGIISMLYLRLMPLDDSAEESPHGSVSGSEDGIELP